MDSKPFRGGNKVVFEDFKTVGPSETVCRTLKPPPMFSAVFRQESPIQKK